MIALIPALGVVAGAVIQARDGEPEDIQLFDVGCVPDRAHPGETITMSFPMEVTGDEGRRVGLGAGLFHGDDQPIYDPANDRMVTVVPGEHLGERAPTREFELPTDLSPGQYELSGQIWRGQPGEDEKGSLEDNACDIVIEP